MLFITNESRDSTPIICQIQKKHVAEVVYGFDEYLMTDKAGPVTDRYRQIHTNNASIQLIRA